VALHQLERRDDGPVARRRREVQEERFRRVVRGDDVDRALREELGRVLAALVVERRAVPVEVLEARDAVDAQPVVADVREVRRERRVVAVPGESGASAFVPDAPPAPRERYDVNDE
jgi:hypothetical protein